jgi:hypothetical protein
MTFNIVAFSIITYRLLHLSVLAQLVVHFLGTKHSGSRAGVERLGREHADFAVANALPLAAPPLEEMVVLALVGRADCRRRDQQ